MFQRQFQVSLLVRKGPKFHNIGTNDVNIIVQQSETIKLLLTLRTRFGKQFLLVTSSTSVISFVAGEKVEKRNFSACNKGNRGCVHPGNIEVTTVGKIQQIKHNCITTIYSSFKHFQLRNKIFIESFHYKVISNNFLLILSENVFY